jgi:hypothetical protein
MDKFSAHNRQLSIFPELEQYPSIPSITTHTDFDILVENIIRLSDLGAFVEYHISGMDKSYSLRLRDMKIPAEYFRNPEEDLFLEVALFSQEIIREVARIKYEIRAFFTSKNSLQTSFGPFLFRPYFDAWHNHLNTMREKLHNFFRNQLGGKKYFVSVKSAVERGFTFVGNAFINHPYRLSDKISQEWIRSMREQINSERKTISQLSSVSEDFIIDYLIIKTQHFPLTLKEFLDNVKLSSVFKVVHFHHLSGIQIQSIRDIFNLIP